MYAYKKYFDTQVWLKSIEIWGKNFPGKLFSETREIENWYLMATLDMSASRTRMWTWSTCQWTEHSWNTYSLVWQFRSNSSILDVGLDQAMSYLSPNRVRINFCMLVEVLFPSFHNYAFIHEQVSLNIAPYKYDVSKTSLLLCCLKGSNG